jgi:NTP pyrophosphatase (non-canonical NTP hydrolase)
MPSRRDYFRQLAVKFGLRPDHHNVSDLMNMARSHEFFGEAITLERILGRRGDLNSSVFIESFLESVAEEDLAPLHMQATGILSPEKPMSDEYAELPSPIGKPGRTVESREEFSFDQLTREHTVWIQHNFPEQLIDPLRADDGFDGLVEEVGELARARLKKRQGIRGTPEEHDANIRDSVGDIVIFLNSWCIAHGINLGDCVHEAWKEVRERDWKKYPKTGRPVPELAELTQIEAARAMVEKHNAAQQESVVRTECGSIVHTALGLGRIIDMSVEIPSGRREALIKVCC